MPGIVTWAVAALGGGTLGTLATGWLNRRKTAAEASRTTAEATRTTAEARKIDADTDATRAETADHMIAILRAQVDRQQADLDRQAVEIDRLRTTLEAVRRATEDCERHRAEDRMALDTVRAENAGFRARLDELMKDLHRREASRTGDGR